MPKRSLLLILIIIMTMFTLLHSFFSELTWSTYSKGSNALIQATGYIGPAISSECTATRNPILEAICACLGDLPGGYCYHLSCGIVGIPVMPEESNQIQIVHN
jgi:hypothetical protein